MHYPWPSKVNIGPLRGLLIRTDPMLDADRRLRDRFRTPAHVIVGLQAAAVEKRRRKRMTRMLASCAGAIGLTRAAIHETIADLIEVKVHADMEHALLFGTTAKETTP
jgi:hypothetical protein